jgi:hypothetical protein
MLGPSVIKTIAFDDRGTENTLARQETEVLPRAPGFSEQDRHSQDMYSRRKLSISR